MNPFPTKAWRALGLLAIFGAAVLSQNAGYRQGYAAAQTEAAEAKVRKDAFMAKLGLCEWPKAFYAETHCGSVP